MQRINGINVWGNVDEATINQMETISETAVFTALMADGHVGYSMPIGGVAAYNEHISPSGVGYDIGCGNTAIRLDTNTGFINRVMLSEIMDEIWNTISFGVGRKNNETVSHQLFNHAAWDIPFVASLKDLAESQLGTVGSGNHYVDLFREVSNGNLWIGTHFGSRGLGHKIASHYLKLAGGKFVAPTLINVNTDLGQEYLAAMNLAGEYAKAGREWVCERVRQIVGGEVLKTVNNHHNFAWKETHFGGEYWVVRKGSTPLFPGQESFVGSNMADNSYILEGLDSEESQKTMYSTIHGAGRIMSRTQAAGKSKWQNGKKVRVSSGEVSHEMMMERVNESGVQLRGAGTDESPHCYKPMLDVLHAHRNTLKVKHVLRPIGVAMAGEDIYDEYKD